MPDQMPTPDQMAAALQQNPQNQQASGLGMSQYANQMGQMNSPFQSAMQGPMNPAQAGGMNAMMNQMGQHNPMGGMLGTPPPPPPAYHPPSAGIGQMPPGAGGQAGMLGQAPPTKFQDPMGGGQQGQLHPMMQSY